MTVSPKRLACINADFESGEVVKAVIVTWSTPSKRKQRKSETGK